jgi:hypothetical protein
MAGFWVQYNMCNIHHSHLESSGKLWFGPQTKLTAEDPIDYLTRFYT